MSTLNQTTIRPGLMVSMKTSTAGNATYVKTVIEPEHVTETGTEEAKWETQRIVADPVEYEAAKIARGKATTAVKRVCIQTSFGLLCPKSRLSELEASVLEARGIVTTFNATSKLTRLSLFVICGHIADNDVEAVRAVASEMSGLIADMERGIENVDAETIRGAANRARALSGMLSAEAAEKVRDVVETARAVARKIVKAGEQAAQEVDRAAMKMLSEARTAFLDLDQAGGEATADVGAPDAEARAIDLETPAQDNAKFPGGAGPVATFLGGDDDGFLVDVPQSAAVTPAIELE